MNNNLFYFLTANNCCSETAKNIFNILETGQSNYIINGDFVIIEKNVQASRFGLIYLCEDTTSSGIVYQIYKKSYNDESPKKIEFQLRECLKHNGVSEDDIDFIVSAIYTKKMQVITQNIIVYNWDIQGSDALISFIKERAGVEFVDDVYLANDGTYNNYSIYHMNTNFAI